MVYLFTALYCEAHIFIKQYKLIKNQQRTWFQEFYNEADGIRLAVTGVGEIAASATVSSVCSLYRPMPDDLLLNVGICAHAAKNEGIFLCNKIIEEATGRTFYPDMLYRHNFCEETIVTRMLPWHGGNASCAANLYDMEAAAVYQAGARFFGPHQMSFLKIVSDSGAVKDISKERVTHLMERYQDSIFDYIRRMAALTQANSRRQKELCQEDTRLIGTFCADLHCSKAMRDSVQQYIRYLTLAGTDYISVIQDMYEKELLPCKDKREGKQRFEEFKKRLF